MNKFKNKITIKLMIKYSILPFIIMGFTQCSEEKRLPILGERKVVNGDTVYAKIPPFKLTDQYNKTITNADFKGKIVITDFVFLSCPTICPKMTKEVNKVYSIYKNDPNVYFLSHTIDPKRDTVERLNAYAKDLGIKNNKWRFVTGEEKVIHDLANKGYFMQAFPDKEAPGGYTHSGGLLLIDGEGRIRGVYDGTNSDETKRLIDDIRVLLIETEKH